MKYSFKEKLDLINTDIINETSKNPIDILEAITKNGYIDQHGPEHHFLIGACFLVAFKNSGGDISIKDALHNLRIRCLATPEDQICGYWSYCGAVYSLRTALSIIFEAEKLPDAQSYIEQDEFRKILNQEIGSIDGPRCCKRNGYISLIYAVKYMKEKYDVNMEVHNIVCKHSLDNPECFKEGCFFYKK
ncbi:MAG: DUF5714 domain-containing protein [Bacilli bacterium]